MAGGAAEWRLPLPWRLERQKTAHAPFPRQLILAPLRVGRRNVEARAEVRLHVLEDCNSHMGHQDGMSRGSHHAPPKGAATAEGHAGCCPKGLLVGAAAAYRRSSWSGCCPSRWLRSRCSSSPAEKKYTTEQRLHKQVAAHVHLSSTARTQVGAGQVSRRAHAGLLARRVVAQPLDERLRHKPAALLRFPVIIGRAVGGQIVDVRVQVRLQTHTHTRAEGERARSSREDVSV